LVLHRHAVEVVLVRRRRVVERIQREVVRPDLERERELQRDDREVRRRRVREDGRHGYHLPVDQEGDTDLLVRGLGPHRAGHRDASVRIVESLEQNGGQVAATYPEKHVYDVAGHPKIQGQALVDLCAEQGLQFEPEVRLGEEVRTLDRVSDNGEELLRIGTDKGGSYLSRALIITAGHGAFEPRKLGIEGIDHWEGRGLHYV